MSSNDIDPSIFAYLAANFSTVDGSNLEIAEMKRIIMSRYDDKLKLKFPTLSPAPYAPDDTELLTLADVTTMFDETESDPGLADELIFNVPGFEMDTMETPQFGIRIYDTNYDVSEIFNSVRPGIYRLGICKIASVIFVLAKMIKKGTEVKILGPESFDELTVISPS